MEEPAHKGNGKAKQVHLLECHWIVHLNLIKCLWLKKAQKSAHFYKWSLPYMENNNKMKKKKSFSLLVIKPWPCSTMWLNYSTWNYIGDHVQQGCNQIRVQGTVRIHTPCWHCWYFYICFSPSALQSFQEEKPHKTPPFWFRPHPLQVKIQIQIQIFGALNTYR